MTASLATNQRTAVSPLPPVELEDSAAKRWFFNPALDYLFACGGLVWILFGLHHFLLSGTDKAPIVAGLISLSVMGTLFLSEGHTAATLVRAYGQKDLRQRFPFQTTVIPLILVVVAAIGTLVPQITPILIKLYFLTVPHHVMAQAYGIARLYCKKHNYELQLAERLALQLVIHSTVAYATLKQFTYDAWGSATFLGQKVPFWGPLPEPIFLLAQAILVSATILFAGLIIFRSLCHHKDFPMPALLTVATGVAAFTMGPQASGIYWLYVSAFFHATQYLMVVISCHWNESGMSRQTPSQKLASLTTNSSTTRMLGMIVLISVFIFIGTPRILQQFGCNYACAMAAIFAVINFHHVIMDNVLWRLRRKDVQKSLDVL